jgi:hypothetical protein
MARVFTMREGKTTRFFEYTDRSEALQAVGLQDWASAAAAW